MLTGCAGLSAAEVVTEDFMIPSGDRGIDLFVRNKHLAGEGQFKTDRVALYVHGASQASESTFDLGVDGLSWMDFIARHGFDVYLMDVRGYGRSSRPPEMSAPASAHPPIVTTDVAVADAGKAIDFIRARRGVEKISLIGWSWGTVTVGAYAAGNPDKIDRLVLYAPVWLHAPSSASELPPLGAYSSWTVEEARGFLQAGAPPDKIAGLMPDAWFAAWKAAALATDAVGARQSPPVVRTPNGATWDGRRYWQAGRPYYDAARIVSPTLVIYGEWDATLPTTLAQAYFGQLAGAPCRRLVEIGGATHFAMLEINRMQLLHEVQLFLEGACEDLTKTRRAR